MGNPGPRYELTRHNIGFLVADNLAEKHRVKLARNKHKALYGEGEIGGCQVMIAKPMTYMNNSGQAVKSLVSALKILPKQVLVVHDDIDLPLGKIKMKTKGGDAGQKGIRSITERLGTDQFFRVRVGIGRPEDPDDIVDYVLTAFTEGETQLLNEAVEEAVRKVEETLAEMNKRNHQTEENGEW
ncbi:MAG TPA: aminoacyl-tRNA hydrolase [Nitrospinaceae bacterium]|nr:aminoacyl-tRNA hydrolase [Nitrospinaceae bacterium]HJL72930.1 aminoacyl-tRNA hydrolase [Nitrospinaceae bacterium]